MLGDTAKSASLCKQVQLAGFVIAVNSFLIVAVTFTSNNINTRQLPYLSHVFAISFIRVASNVSSRR
jgi:hypothetical protein